MQLIHTCHCHKRENYRMKGNWCYALYDGFTKVVQWSAWSTAQD